MTLLKYGCLVLLLTLTACGQTGGLYMPGAPSFKVVQ